MVNYLLHLNYVLEKFHKAVVFQQLWMDPAVLPNEKDPEQVFTAPNGFIIVIYADVYLRPNELGLWRNGGRPYWAPATLFFQSDEERDEWFDKAVKALKEWNDRKG